MAPGSIPSPSLFSPTPLPVVFQGLQVFRRSGPADGTINLVDDHQVEDRLFVGQISHRLSLEKWGNCNPCLP